MTRSPRLTGPVGRIVKAAAEADAAFQARLTDDQRAILRETRRRAFLEVAYGTPFEAIGDTDETPTDPRG